MHHPSSLFITIIFLFDWKPWQPALTYCRNVQSSVCSNLRDMMKKIQMGNGQKVALVIPLENIMYGTCTIMYGVCTISNSWFFCCVLISCHNMLLCLSLCYVTRFVCPFICFFAVLIKFYVLTWDVDSGFVLKAIYLGSLAYSTNIHFKRIIEKTV